MKEFEGKVAVVTGAGSGIGRAMALAFAVRGMRLAIADIEEAALAGVRSELEARGAEVYAERFDVADRDRFRDFADSVFRELGAVHVVCNNAGVGSGGPLHTIPLEAWDWVFDVNLKAVVYGIHFFVPRMLAAGGPCHVVNTASLAGLIAGPYMGPYNAAKYAVVAISETLAAENAETALGVSVLCPAWVNTRIHESERNKPASVTIGSGGTPEEDAMRAGMADLIRTGLDPAEVAERVIDAIESETLYILTHADYMPLIEARFGRVLAAAPTAQAEPKAS